MEYRIVLTHDTNGTLLVSFPDFPEAHTFGKDEADAMGHAREALETVLDAYISARRAIPEPSKAKSKDHLLRVSALTAAKIDLYRALLASKTSKYALAKKLGWHLPQVDRLFNMKHQSHLEQIEAAATALGKHVNVSVA